MSTYQAIAGELPRHAAVIADHLRRNGFDPARAVERNVIKLAEEAGEVAGAYLRSTGQARRTGTTNELHEEVADVILTAFSLAQALGMDINAVLASKLHKLHTRGWRETPPESADQRYWRKYHEAVLNAAGGDR